MQKGGPAGAALFLWRLFDKLVAHNSLCPREGAGPSPVGAIRVRSKMGPRLRGGTG